MPRPDTLAVAGWLTVVLPLTVALGPAAIDIVASLIVVAFLCHSVVERETAWLKEPWVRAIGAVWLFTMGRAAAVGPSMDHLGLAAAWIRYPLLAVALATWVLRDKQWRDRLLISTAAVCGFLSLDALFQAMTGFDVIGRPLFEGRLTATMSRPRLGITLAWLCLPAVFGLWQAKWVKAAAALALSCLAAIVLSGDRMAFLFVLAGLVGCLVYIASASRGVWGYLLVAAVFVAGMLAVRPDIYDRQVRSTIEAARTLDKTHYGVIWSRALTMARAHPVFGVGMNRYRDVCPDVAYGPIVQSSTGHSACAAHPHNVYLEWLVEGGVVALGGFVAAVMLIGRRLLGAWPVLRHDYVFVALLVTAVLRLFPASSATSLTRSWFSMPLWLVIGWALALAIAVSSTREREKD
jgi:O-antigen ligase